MKKDKIEFMKFKIRFSDGTMMDAKAEEGCCLEILPEKLLNMIKKRCDEVIKHKKKKKAKK